MTCCSSKNHAILDKTSPTAQMERPVELSYGDRRLRAGFHITEAKTSSITSLDCGSNRHSWRETTIQLLDVDGPESGRMSGSKFVHILEMAGLRLDALPDGELIFEIGRTDEAMQLFDFAGVQMEGEKVVIKTRPRTALCKPAATGSISQETGACCGPPRSDKSSCCA
jgi:Family of unknown function (DUF6428)